MIPSLRSVMRLAVCSRRSSSPADGEDGDVVLQRLAGEVACRVQQRLAEHVGVLPRIAAEDARDAVLAEELLSRASLGQTVGVEQQEVARIEADLSARVRALGIQRQQ